MRHYEAFGRSRERKGVGVRLLQGSQHVSIAQIDGASQGFQMMVTRGLHLLAHCLHTNQSLII